MSPSLFLSVDCLLLELHSKKAGRLFLLLTYTLNFTKSDCRLMLVQNKSSVSHSKNVEVETA